MKASVETTDGEVILQTIATRMNKLVKEKVDAVLVSKCAQRSMIKILTFMAFVFARIALKNNPEMNIKLSRIHYK